MVSTFHDNGHSNYGGSDEKVIVYTDGACSGNPGPGGWAAVLRYKDHLKEINGRSDDTTNNRMELTSVIEALRFLRRGCKIEVYCDSKYVINGISKWLPGWVRNNWRRGRAGKTPVKNVDLWQMLVKELERHDVSWHWVKGHSNDRDNDRADELARKAIDGFVL